MKYISTRGSSAVVAASEAIRFGIAPDGGLFIPEVIPQFPAHQLSTMVSRSYHELAVEILSLFLTDYQSTGLQEMVAAAYSYPAKFADPNITPVHQLYENQYLLELWHGPTCAFKDLALQLLPYLMTQAGLLANDSKEIVILVATSGDTGKAALEGFKDVPGTKIIVFFPEQGVSEIQRLQMVSQDGNNTFVVSVKGNFDDAQNGVKHIFSDPRLAQKLNAQNMAFSSANSINWGRLAPQIVYYFYGYLQLVQQGVVSAGEKINITVPTGNFGNILAAYIAKEMGLPVAKLICASNSNHILTDFIKTGLYNRNRDFYTTISPSMDILISSNLERLLYYLSGGNVSLVNQWMMQLKTSGSYQVDQVTGMKVINEFYGGYATESETMSQIKKVYQTCGKVIDPHTAVGVKVYEQYLQETTDETPVLLVSTASPFKFNASVLQALGQGPVNGVNEFILLERLEKLAGMKIPPSLSELAHQQIKHQTVCGKEEMGKVLEKLLGID